MALEAESALREIAFIKDLVERGRRTSATGGWLLIGVGGLFCSASLYHWAVQNRFLALPEDSAGFAWYAAGILTAVLSMALNSRTPRGTTADYVYRATRLSVFAVVFLLTAALAIASWRFRNGDMMELIGPIVATLNGGFWLIFASVQERSPYRWVPVASFAAAIVLAFLLQTEHFYLANAISLFILQVVPGILITRSVATAGTERD
jgi:hypothetical protein